MSNGKLQSPRTPESIDDPKMMPPPSEVLQDKMPNEQSLKLPH